MVYRGRTFGVRINVADRVQKLPMLPMLPLFVVISRIRQIRHVLGLNVAGVANYKKIGNTHEPSTGLVSWPHCC
jgi:hypothetical protein